MNEVQRSKRILKILNKIYPKTPIPLKHRNKFTLLVSVLLSAQTTDVNVNNVTKNIYPKYNKPEHFVKLGRKKIERLIKSIGIFLEYFLIKFSSFFENPVVPITTLFFNFDAIFKTSNVHLGTVKSIIKLAFLKDSSLFKLGLIPATFLLIILFSVRVTILKFLSDLADLIIC